MLGTKNEAICQHCRTNKSNVKYKQCKKYNQSAKGNQNNDYHSSFIKTILQLQLQLFSSFLLALSTLPFFENSQLVRSTWCQKQAGTIFLCLISMFTCLFLTAHNRLRVDGSTHYAIILLDLIRTIFFILCFCQIFENF